MTRRPGARLSTSSCRAAHTATRPKGRLTRKAQRQPPSCTSAPPSGGPTPAATAAEAPHPPMAGVGLTEARAKNQLGSVKPFTSDFRAMKNVLAGRNERSLYKLVVDAAPDEVVGIHMIGPDAPEILQAAAIAVKARLKKADFDRTMALHPTMSEELVLMR